MRSFLFHILTNIVLITIFRFNRINVLSLPVLMGHHCWGAYNKEASLRRGSDFAPIAGQTDAHHLACCLSVSVLTALPFLQSAVVSAQCQNTGSVNS